MLNFWNTTAIVYLILMLLGMIWMLDDDEKRWDSKSIRRLSIECRIMQAIMCMWVLSMIVFPVLMILGQYASAGEVWGLIKVR